MRCLISNNPNPNFNLATEEYFLKNSNEEFFMLYINEPCIVVGKHQNLLAEINLRYAQENNIKLARRISGGGTVYQDFNNLNFSFIHNCEIREQINFRKFTYPILESLKEMGLNVEFSERNDILLESKKISGNAMHIYKTRVLSHGTLLFNTDLKNLSTTLNNNSERYIDKSIKSVRSDVTNIFDHLGHAITIGLFTEEIFKKINNNFHDSYSKSLSKEEQNIIQEISQNKFETWDWLYGYSPKYAFKNSFEYLNTSIEVELSIEHGIIVTARIKTNKEEYPKFIYSLKHLVNKKHDFDTISRLISNIYLNNSMPRFNISEFCYNLF